MQRIGLVVHPSREIAGPLDTLARWADQRGIERVQLRTPNQKREVAPFGEVSRCDLVVAIGGDGTVLTALRAAADSDAPVLGVACGSLGALSAVTAPELERALDLFEQDEWQPRKLDALKASVDGEQVAWALNDFVLVRRTGQLVVDVTVGTELYARTAGDGVIAATALGSSAYSMASGGPIIVAGADAFVVTPLLMHGGNAPPIVVRKDTHVTLDAQPGYAGFDVEVDGHRMEIEGTRFTVTLSEHTATLVALAEPGLGITALRRRGLITDSPRVLARDERSAGRAQ
ncbi:MAG: kinase [Thermoleophilaceae bacterium]|nr:kinase [Thermoleophilaceae bacterium]